MENKNFDSIIRSKLENLNFEPDAQSWDAFAEKLTIAEAAGPADLDQLYKEKLENINVPVEPNAWSRFQEKLVLDDLLSEEPADSFDVLVKDKLEGIFIPPVADSWAAFEEKLELEETFSTETIEDMYVDALAYEKLNALDVPYEPAHWNEMSKKIDEEDDSVIGFIFRYKIAEAALILLTLITLNQYFPLKSTFDAVVDSNGAIFYPEKLPVLQDEKQDCLELNGEELAAKTASSPNITRKEITPILSDNISVKATTKDKLMDETETALLLADANVPPAEIAFTSSVPEFGSAGHNTVNNGLVGSEMPTTYQQAEGRIEEIRIDVTERTQPEMDVIVPFAPGVDIAEAQLLAELESATDEKLPECKACKKPVVDKPFMRVGMVSAFDVNYVNVPYDELFSKEATKRIGLGYGNGVSIGLRLGKWEVETGALYTARNYTPRIDSSLYGSLTTGYYRDYLKRVNLNILSIPLNLKYAFKNTAKWSLYAHAGLNLNLLLTAAYDREQVVETGPKNYAARVALFQSSDLNDKRFDPGLFEGGSFLENHYYTVNLGLGVERHLSARWSIFTQATYHQQMFSDGVGPNSDRINSLSVFGGAKVSLR